MTVWEKDTAGRIYTRERAADLDENGYYGGGIGTTDGLCQTYSKPVTLREASKKAITRTNDHLRKGEVEAIAVWKNESLKTRVAKVAVIISGEDVAKLGRWEAIEVAIEAKAPLKAGEQVSNYSVTSETSKYSSSVETVTGSKIKYYIIGNGINMSRALQTAGFDTRTEARAALKTHLARTHDGTFGLPSEENFEIIGVTKVAEAKSELSKLVVRAEVTIASIDPNKPYDGWHFYGVGAM